MGVVLVLGSLVDLHRTDQLQLFDICGWGIDLDYCDVEWFALETNQDHSVVLESAPKYDALGFASKCKTCIYLHFGLFC